MKKVITSGVVIISFVIYAVLHATKQEVVTPPTTSVTGNNTSQSSNSNIVSSPTNSASSLYKDGEYTGDAADAFYGNIQVKAVIQNGKLVDVIFLQYPNDHYESIQINQGAMPILRQEAIAAQKAEVDGVTRATDSSIAFVQSLTSALNQAKQ